MTTVQLSPSEMTPAERRSSRIVVLEAICALHDQEMPVTVDAIVRHTSLKTVTVADCIKELRERDVIWSPERGVYRPRRAAEHASQPVSITVLPGGRVKLEKGDQVMEFTAREWRMQVAPMAAGACAQTAIIEHTHHTMQLVDQVIRLRRRVDGLDLAQVLLEQEG